ncbi:hypothetical protein BGZ47_007908 [Haplosporangium gracile]|nr:hypothetical protein BGZ47_007908 [Haplosporangium gracile]
MLNELSRIEMFVTRIETVGKHEETSAELNRTIAHLEQTLIAFEVDNGHAARIENTSGRVMTGLAEMFPKSSEYLGIELVLPGGSYIEAHFQHMSSINQLTSIALQLQNDIKLTNHKFVAHQVALLYQCITQAGSQFSKKYKSRVEENFDALKEASSVSDEPYLPIELQAWLNDLTTDIVAEALFSGRPMSQQTPDAAHLSQYIDKVSSEGAEGGMVQAA